MVSSHLGAAVQTPPRAVLLLGISLGLVAGLGAACADGDEPLPVDPADTDPPGDTTAPAVRISDDATGVADRPVTFTFTFTEDVGTSLKASSIEVEGGSSGELTWNGLTASIIVTPPDGERGTLRVTVPVESFEDLAGNPNVLDATASRGFDTRGPTSGAGTVLFDFEGSDPGEIVPFGGITGTLVDDPNESGNRVAALSVPSGAEIWTGASLSYCPDDGISVLPFSSGQARITARLWSPRAGTSVRLKVENTSDATISAETEVQTTAAEAWETLVFDLSKPVEGTPALDRGATYDRLSIFPDFGSSSGPETYYLDDVRFEGVRFDTECPVIVEDANLMDNAGFEDTASTTTPAGWLVFPTEGGRYGQTPATDGFVPSEGVTSLFMYGQNTGTENFTALYQEFKAEPGETYTFAARAWSFEPDPVTPPNYALIAVKFFDDEFNFLGQATSPRITPRSPTGRWLNLEATSTVPPRATIVQASIEYWQCEKSTDCYAGGAVLFDETRFFRH